MSEQLRAQQYPATHEPASVEPTRERLEFRGEHAEERMPSLTPEPPAPPVDAPAPPTDADPSKLDPPVASASPSGAFEERLVLLMRAELNAALRDVPTRAELNTALRDIPMRAELNTALRDIPTRAEMDARFDKVPTKDEINARFDNCATKEELQKAVNRLTWQQVGLTATAMAGTVGAMVGLFNFFM